MLINNVFGVVLLLIEGNNNIASFIFVLVLLLALVYSVAVLREKNNLINEQNKKLEIQNHRLQKINDEKSNLISVVSHDLKSPFNRIFALVNLIKMTTRDDSEEHIEYLSKMHQVVKDGLSLIRNLLDMRAIEDKGISMKMDRLDIVRLANDIANSHIPLAEIKDIKIEFTSLESSYHIFTDKLYITRILDNLISNALKFCDKGSLVGVHFSKSNKGLVLLDVIDNGPGISEADQSKLFNKYQILSAKPTDGESSTGLGLSIVKLLTEKLGGKVSCKSEIGKGTTFSIELPEEFTPQS